MKTNKIEHRNRTAILASAAAVLLILGVGIAVCYGRLKDVYLEQSVITDMSAQVSITSGKMVMPDVIAENLGLRKGANLATIDFAAKREELLAKVPNLLSVRISRKLPDRITVTADERTPVARMGLRSGPDPSGRVVDTEGMVFVWQRGTQTLPLIRESQNPDSPRGTPRGQRIKGRTLAALRLLEACREPEFIELGILEVETSHHDFLVATLGNYSKLKILWNEMDESTPNSRVDLVKRLTLLRNAIRTKLQNTVIWNATIPGVVTSDSQEKP